MHFRCMRYVFLLLIAFTFACEKDEPEIDRLILIENKVLSDDVIHGYKINYESNRVESVDIYKYGVFRYTIEESKPGQVNYLQFNPFALIGLSQQEVNSTLNPEFYNRSNEVLVVSGRLERIKALDNVITFQYE